MPPANRIPGSLEGVTIEQYMVCSWCPTSDGSGPATAVGFVLDLRLSSTVMQCVMRLKSPAAVDTLIESLKRHKADVWPQAR